MCPLRDGIRIIRYHGVVEALVDPLLERNFHLLSDFRAHVRALRRVPIMTLSELEATLASRSFPPEGAHVITFDDGYANNLAACEILDGARIPCAIFVSTGAVGRQQTNWTAELSLLVLHGDAEQIETHGTAWVLTDRELREKAYHAIRRGFKVLPATRRRAAMNELRRQFPPGETHRLLRRFAAFQMLSWEEMAQLGGAGVEIGSHGVHHELHHAQQPRAVRNTELSDSRAQLEGRLGHPCRAFAFPNGDFTTTSADEVDVAGYALAVTIESGPVTPGTNPCLLPRVKAPVSPREFEAALAGTGPWASVIR